MDRRLLVLALGMFAIARYPSSLTWYSHSGPSGIVGTARHSMSSLNVAGHRGKDFSVRSSSPDVMLKIRTVGDGLAAAYRAEGTPCFARCS